MPRLLVLVFPLALLAAAQRSAAPGGGTGTMSSPNATRMQQEMSSVQVRVLGNNEAAVAEGVRVQLLRTDGSTVVAETMSMEGMAQFRGVAPGHYILHVAGSTIEDTTTPSFEVPATAATTVQFVHVKMKSPDGPGGRAPGLVSVQDLNVPRKAREEFAKAGDAMQHSDWKNATEHLNKAVSIYPQYAAAYNNLGVVAMKQNDLPKAKQMFQKAADLHDSTGSAYLNLGRLYLGEHNYDEAARMMNKALVLDPNNPEALTMLSDCELATGHYPEAATHARRVHAVPHERFAVAHLIAGSAFEKQNDNQQAAAEYEQFLKEDPNSPRAALARKALERLAAEHQPAGATPRP